MAQNNYFCYLKASLTMAVIFHTSQIFFRYLKQLYPGETSIIKKYQYLLFKLANY